MGDGKTPPEQPTPGPARLERLIQMAQEINSELDDLSVSSGRQFTRLSRTARVNRMMIWGVIMGGLLDAALTVVLIIFGIGQAENTERIDKLATQTSTMQTEQRQRALCPLYGIFVDSKSAEGRAAAPDKQKYDHAFEVIEEGYKFLECDQYLKESGRDKW